jgi:Isochorismatase family
LQTALRLASQGVPTVVVSDATASHDPEHRQAAIRRLEQHGIEIITTEMALYEWMGSYEHPQCRAILDRRKAQAIMSGTISLSSLAI